MSFQFERVRVESIWCDTRGCEAKFTAYFPETTQKQLRESAIKAGWKAGGYTIKDNGWYHGIFKPQHACPEHELDEWMKL